MYTAMTAAAAETLTLKAFGFLVNSPAALDRFLAESGSDILNLRARAAEPEFLAAVMDFLLADDGVAGAFCDSEGIEPAMLHRARRALPGAAPG
jgi:hypothetical protein